MYVLTRYLHKRIIKKEDLAAYEFHHHCTQSHKSNRISKLTSWKESRVPLSRSMYLLWPHRLSKTHCSELLLCRLQKRKGNLRRKASKEHIVAHGATASSSHAVLQCFDSGDSVFTRCYTTWLPISLFQLREVEQRESSEESMS